MVWIIGVASSLIGAAVWALVAYLIEAQRARSGPVAGDWYQVTYDPGNAELIWSIEWVEARNKGNSISGTMWRVYPHHFDRRWRFAGRYQDSFIRAQYWSDRGDGGEGSMKLMKYRKYYCIGRFEEEQMRSFGPGVDFGEFAAPMQWVRVDADVEQAILEKIEIIPEHEMFEYLPRRIRHRIARRLKKEISPTQQIMHALAYGSFLTDLSAPLANEVERLRELANETQGKIVEQARSQRQDQDGQLEGHE